jgi:hypothetical protein
VTEHYQMITDGVAMFSTIGMGDVSENDHAVGSEKAPARSAKVYMFS